MLGFIKKLFGGKTEAVQTAEVPYKVEVAETVQVVVPEVAPVVEAVAPVAKPVAKAAPKKAAPKKAAVAKPKGQRKPRAPRQPK